MPRCGRRRALLVSGRSCLLIRSPVLSHLTASKATIRRLLRHKSGAVCLSLGLASPPRNFWPSQSSLSIVKSATVLADGLKFSRSAHCLTVTQQKLVHLHEPSPKSSGRRRSFGVREVPGGSPSVRVVPNTRQAVSCHTTVGHRKLSWSVLYPHPCEEDAGII